MAKMAAVVAGSAKVIHLILTRVWGRSYILTFSDAAAAAAAAEDDSLSNDKMIAGSDICDFVGTLLNLDVNRKSFTTLFRVTHHIWNFNFKNLSKAHYWPF